MTLYLSIYQKKRLTLSEKSGFTPGDHLFAVEKQRIHCYSIVKKGGQLLLKKERFSPPITPRQIPFLPWIKLTKELILFIGGKRGKKGLIPLHTTDHFKIQNLFKKTSYQNLRQFKIVDAPDRNSIDLQLFYRNQKLNLHPAPFIEQQLINQFQDPLYLKGQGQPGKDRLMTLFENQKTVTEKECSMGQFYILFCTPYRVDPGVEQARLDQAIDGVIADQKLPLNTIYTGVPGTGKTYRAINHALEVIYGTIHNRTAQVQSAINSGQLEIITLHQNYGYEEFIQGIRAETEQKKIHYNIRDGVFLKLARRAIENYLAPRKTTPLKQYVCVVDELNRGNITAIFGEMITLLETTKRLNGSDQITITLPHTGESITLPPNLYLVATLNSGDHTTIPLDYALRRRFHFIECLPDPDFLPEDLYGINLKQLFITLNRRIHHLLGEHYLLGHTEWLNIETLEDLKTVFLQKVIPHLVTLCGGDHLRVNLILNNNGFLKQHNAPEKLFYRHLNVDPYHTINRDAFDQIERYQQIYL